MMDSSRNPLRARPVLQEVRTDPRHCNKAISNNSNSNNTADSTIHTVPEGTVTRTGASTANNTVREMATLTGSSRPRRRQVRSRRGRESEVHMEFVEEKVYQAPSSDRSVALVMLDDIFTSFAVMQAITSADAVLCATMPVPARLLESGW